MFKELTDPIPYWNRYARTTRWNVRTKDGDGFLGVDKGVGGTFIDTTCTFYFETIDEAWDAAQRYYSWYNMVYTYALVTLENGHKRCVNWDGTECIHDEESSGTVSEPMEFA